MRKDSPGLGREKGFSHQRRISIPQSLRLSVRIRRSPAAARPGPAPLATAEPSGAGRGSAKASEAGG